jgi:hypothetical protein
MFYRLEGRNPVKCATGQEWAEWYEAACLFDERIIDRYEIGPFLVSTVFVGIDPNAVDADPPQLFETMTFKDGESIAVARSATWEQAEAAQRQAVSSLHVMRFPAIADA